VADHRIDATRGSEGDVKNSQIYAIMGAVYLAPHMSKAVCIGVGVYMVLCSLYAMWREA
jgi:hypothetical protein